VSAESHALDQRAGPLAAPSRAWAIVGALSVTETVSWGVLYYAFAVFLVPMQRDLGLSAAQLTGAFSVALLVSGVAGIGIGRFLDRQSPRTLMTAGSLGGALLVLAWSQIESLAAFYALWIGIGIVMAAVLYEPAFTVLAKWFPLPQERRRAMTAMTLVAALASFIFLPLSQTLIGAHGWRDALVVLALLLAVITVPLHALVLRPAPAAANLEAASLADSGPRALRPARRQAERTARDRRSLRARRGGNRSRCRPAWHRRRADRACPRRHGQRMATLARATIIADRYRPGAYGTIAGVAASVTTAARAAGPIAAALWASLVGYSALLWTLSALAALAAALGYRAQRAPRPQHLRGRGRAA